jgi:hypothetical protein
MFCLSNISNGYNFKFCHRINSYGFEVKVLYLFQNTRNVK